ncbi:GreA/GreB family elongation factor [Psychroflexus aestuariivivens]|uniref:GreA/GreB family elongation factor n=1 Tax=Psychroflexus aestuariivivens TaxID=1795040 RepID=UPI000FD7FD31|nr:GreA/GreB family elongation factor [Psychroflexus aestuariivivens]
MSRGFVKESDQEEAPIIPPRAALPEGQINYVTPKGLDMLENEKTELQQSRSELNVDDDTERRRALTVIDGKLKLLQDRLNSAQLIQPKDQPQDEVRFGAKVTFRMNANKQEFQIVGVDEADVKQKKIAFTSPIAKSMTGHKVGNSFEFSLGTETKSIEILAIEY